VTARPLLLIGAGEQARKALAVVRSRPGDWVPVGALADDPAWHGRDLDGIPVLGGIDLVHQLPDAALLACDPNVVDRLGLPANRWVCVR
jgi:FlaA1/EpsC-like NDP-sugar epimerase